ncbi:MAG: hypothetical protein ABIO45_00350 [Burkholderiaceae bacterium]
MNSPNETMHISAAADDYAVDLGAAPLSAIDIQKSISDNPMSAAMVAAIAGAGLMGLMMLTMRSRRSSAQALVERATPNAATREDLASLRDQVGGWAREIIAAAPSRGEMKNLRDHFTSWARDAMAGAPSRGEIKQAASDAGDAASSTWTEVRDQASDLAQRVRSQVEDTADKLRPKVNAAVDLAKENPMWVGVAAAAIAAVIGASAIANSRR